MKIGFMMLPFLCVAGVAMADGMDQAAANQTAAAPAKASAHHRMEHNRPKRLPSGDLRHCLELKTSKEIIRCSEMRRKQ